MFINQQAVCQIRPKIHSCQFLQENVCYIICFRHDGGPSGECWTTGSRVSKIGLQIGTLTHNIKDVNLRLQVLEYKSVDAEARLMRYKFRGIPEVLINEDCEQWIWVIICDELHINFSVYIRIGRLDFWPINNGITNTRPIVECFRDCEDVEMIMANVINLNMA